ncbi:MAG TPA: aminotransferase class IV [Micromonosporaceae bacterium]
MTGAAPARYVWYDGEIRPGDEIALSVANHSLHYGLSVFEGVNAFPSDGGGHHLFRLGEHLSRLAASCALVGLRLPHPAEQLSAGCHQVLDANRLRRAYLRPIAFLGDGVLGLAPPDAAVHVAVLAFPTDVLDDVVRREAVRLTLSKVPRVSADAMPMKAKTAAGYLNSRIAILDAWQRGFHDALMLDDQGFVAECTVQNVFGVRARTLHIPVSDGALDGITMASAVDLAADLGYRVSHRRLTPNELLDCDSLCVASTAGGVRPVSVVDTHAYPTDSAVVARLRSAYDDAERGRHPGFRHWCS